MKKTKTSNPLKFFNDAKAARNKSFKLGGVNVPTQSLPKKYNGGPGSGMGSMYAADQAYDSMMSEPAPTVVRRTPKMIDPRKYTPNPKTMSSMFKDPGSLGTPPTPEDLKNMKLYNSGPANTTMENINPYQEKDGGMMKKGGTTKTKKFAALAPPFNKATAADRIAGAKKNVRKKK